MSPDREVELAGILSEPLAAPIGARHLYASTGYTLLAAIVEIASGTTSTFLHRARRPAAQLFPLKGSNWFPRGQSANEEQCKTDIVLLEKVHRALREAVANLSDRDLSRKTKGSKITNAFIISGIAVHDLYHAGQIQLLKNL